MRIDLRPQRAQFRFCCELADVLLAKTLFVALAREPQRVDTPCGHERDVAQECHVIRQKQAPARKMADIDRVSRRFGRRNLDRELCRIRVDRRQQRLQLLSQDVAHVVVTFHSAEALEDARAKLGVVGPAENDAVDKLSRNALEQRIAEREQDPDDHGDAGGDWIAAEVVLGEHGYFDAEIESRGERDQHGQKRMARLRNRSASAKRKS